MRFHWFRMSPSPRLRLSLGSIIRKRRHALSKTILRNTEETTLGIEFDYHSHAIAEQGVVPVVTVDHPAFLSATLRPDNATVDIVSVDGAVGNATVTVTATLPDGIVLTQSQAFAVVAPEADAITLHVGVIAEKAQPNLAPAA